MKTTLNAIGGFILAAIIAVALVGNLNFWQADLTSASEATHWAVVLTALVAAIGLRGVSARD